MKLKIGVVPYLNALPLYHSLKNDSRFEIFGAIPSKLAPMLARGECDVALIPVVEHFRGVGDAIISNSCVGCTGNVRSVLLFHRVPMEAVKSVALDTSSRSSVALVQVILHDLFRLAPQLNNAAPDLSVMLRDNDAALLIGDNALLAAQNVPAGIRVLDLGEAWQRLTGLSFVFAAWVTRRDFAQGDELAEILDAARVWGVENSDEIARIAAQTSPIALPVITSYFRDAIEYSMTDSHRAALVQFRERCGANSLL